MGCKHYDKTEEDVPDNNKECYLTKCNNCDKVLSKNLHEWLYAPGNFTHSLKVGKIVKWDESFISHTIYCKRCDIDKSIKLYPVEMKGETV